MTTIEGYDSFIQAKWYHKGRQGKRIRLMVAHCTVSPESGTGAESVARYFANPSRKGSTHCVADSNTVVGCVHDTDTAFGAGGANNDGWHFELVGQPHQSLPEWTDTFSISMFRTISPVVRAKAIQFGIPFKWLTVAEIRAGHFGFCTHADIEAAYPSSGHWDPGPNFPKVLFMEFLNPTTVAKEEMATILRVLNGPTPQDDQYFITDGFLKRGANGFGEVVFQRDRLGARVIDVTAAEAASIPSKV